MQSELLGAYSTGIHNLICITGDPPKLGNYPDATAVFDVDAIGLVNVVRNLNCGLDIGKNSIGESTGFTISVAANPGVPDIDQEVRRFAYKVEAGAEFASTELQRRCWGWLRFSSRGQADMASFEEQLTALEAVVERLERGELTLDESVRLFEEGVKLSNACKKELGAAEGRIQVLVEPGR